MKVEVQLRVKGLFISGLTLLGVDLDMASGAAISKVIPWVFCPFLKYFRRLNIINELHLIRKIFFSGVKCDSHSGATFQSAWPIRLFS